MSASPAAAEGPESFLAAPPTAAARQPAEGVVTVDRDVVAGLSFAALEGAPCASGPEYCVEIVLASAAYLRLVGETSHDHGCGDYDGTLAIARRDRTLEVSMPSAYGSNRPCRARVTMSGERVIGPLPAGTWTIQPVGRYPLRLQLTYAAVESH